MNNEEFDLAITVDNAETIYIVEIDEGQPGNDGKDGKDGKDGNNGKSAYQLAVEEGFSGTLEEWLESLKGEPGASIWGSLTGDINNQTDLKNIIDSINTNIDTLDTELSNVNIEINDIKDNISSINTEITSINNNIDDIEIDISNIKTDITRLDDTDTSIINDLNTVKNNITSIDNNIDNIQNLLDLVSTQVSYNTSDISNINTEITSINTNIDNIEIDISNIKTDITRLDDTDTSIINDLNIVKNDVTNINNNIDNIEDNLENLTTQVGTNTSDISNIENNLNDLSEEINNIHSVPIGGTTGQLLAKKTNTDYDLEWINIEQSNSILNKNVVLALPYVFGETSANAQIIGVNLSTTYLEGIQPTSKVFNSNELYFARPRALFKHSNSPASAGLQSYITFNNDYYIGNTNGYIGGFINVYDFAIENNLDNLSQLYVGLCSEFIRVPSFSTGLQTVRNLLGIGYNSSDTIFHIYTNDNNNNGASKIPLSSFIGNLTTNDILARVKENPYRLEINVDRGGNNIRIKFTNLISKNSGYYILPVGTKLPSFNRFLKPCFIISTGQSITRTDGIVFYKFIGYTNYYE